MADGAVCRIINARVLGRYLSAAIGLREQITVAMKPSQNSHCDVSSYRVLSWIYQEADLPKHNALTGPDLEAAALFYFLTR